MWFSKSILLMRLYKGKKHKDEKVVKKWTNIYKKREIGAKTEFSGRREK